MTHWILVTAGTTGRFTVIMAFLTAMLGLLGLVVKTAYRIGRSVVRQIEATEANTLAVHDLAQRMQKLEQARA